MMPGDAWPQPTDRYRRPPPAPPMRELLALLRQYLHLDDTGHVWFSTATAVSASFDGPPLWGMLVGASSGGKTETISTFDGHARHVDEITSASLLSWHHARKGGWTPVGVLLDIGERGLLTVGDFSTVLAMSDRGARDQLFSNLRRVYDGYLTRDIGNAPRALTWSGRVTILAGCTPAIDVYAAHADQLGPRWLHYRLAAKPTAEKRATSRKAREAAAVAHEYRKKARTLTASIIQDASRRTAAVELSPTAGEEIDDMAIVTCYGRGAVPRNGYGRREIEGLPNIEDPPRVTGQLTQLATGLCALGLDEPAALALCRRAALDSMPGIRRRVLQVLVDATGDQPTVSDVAHRAGCHRAVARRTLEDLQALGLADGEEYDDEDPRERYLPHRWWLAGDDAELVRAVFKAERWHEM